MVESYWSITTADDAHSYRPTQLLSYYRITLYNIGLHLFKLYMTAKLYTMVKLYAQLYSSEEKILCVLQILLILLQRIVIYVKI